MGRWEKRVPAYPTPPVLLCDSEAAGVVGDLRLIQLGPCLKLSWGKNDFLSFSSLADLSRGLQAQSPCRTPGLSLSPVFPAH